MADHYDHADPTRPLPCPVPDADGNFRATTTLSPVECKSRARLSIPSTSVIPVIFIPGIMGSNLRASTAKGAAPNRELKPGEAAWRPPNGSIAALKEAKLWKGRPPAVRQRILDPAALEVDDSGDMLASHHSDVVFDRAVQKARGWGEVYCDSYGHLLRSLEVQLNTVFTHVDGGLKPRSSWRGVAEWKRYLWDVHNATGATVALTDGELKKVAQNHFPVYAMGYNWLQSNELSSERLEKRIKEIITFWTDRKQKCTQVILVTHSMGGLVARACAKRIPEKVLGIVHGVMPALGAPVCYRRIACGTEPDNPLNGPYGDFVAGKFAEIAGRTQADTTAVMATAAGPLELLPNNEYPKPWLHVTFDNYNNSTASLSLPRGNVYDMYRDTTSWFRMIDPALADPANKYGTPASVAEKINKAIKQAERFHTTVLGDYYHPNSYAFYGNDAGQLSFGTCRWHAPVRTMSPDTTIIRSGASLSRSEDGGRTVKFADESIVHFTHSSQDVPGDGTVPRESGVGPKGRLKEIYSTKGYDHQGSYGNDGMLALTVQLIARIVQDAK
jgi:pimeloyl-ACP methyl ester carboxylesterase